MQMVRHALLPALHLATLLLVSSNGIVAFTISAVASRDGLLLLFTCLAEHGSQILDLIFELSGAVTIFGDGLRDFFVFVLPAVEFLANALTSLGKGG